MYTFTAKCNTVVYYHLENFYSDWRKLIHFLNSYNSLGTVLLLYCIKIQHWIPISWFRGYTEITRGGVTRALCERKEVEEVEGCEVMFWFEVSDPRAARRFAAGARAIVKRHCSQISTSKTHSSLGFQQLYFLIF